MFIASLALSVFLFSTPPPPTPGLTPTPGSTAEYIGSTVMPADTACPLAGTPSGWLTLTPDAFWNATCGRCFSSPTPDAALWETTFPTSNVPTQLPGTGTPPAVTVTPPAVTVTPGGGGGPVVSPTAEIGMIYKDVAQYSSRGKATFGQSCSVRGAVVYCIFDSYFPDNISPNDGWDNVQQNVSVRLVGSSGDGATYFYNWSAAAVSGPSIKFTGRDMPAAGEYSVNVGGLSNPNGGWDVYQTNINSTGANPAGHYRVYLSVSANGYVDPSEIVPTLQPTATPQSGYCSSLHVPSAEFTPFVWIDRQNFQCYVIPGFSVGQVVAAISWVLPQVILDWANGIVFPGTTVCVFSVVFGRMVIFGFLVDLPLVFSFLIVGFILHHFVSK